jgi:hypothetical protein
MINTFSVDGARQVSSSAQVALRLAKFSAHSPMGVA